MLIYLYYNMFTKLKSIFKRKPSLRQQCVDAYGPEFGEMYDTLNAGGTIGGFLETACFIDMLNAVKRGEPLKPINSDEDGKQE